MSPAALSADAGLGVLRMPAPGSGDELSVPPLLDVVEEGREGVGDWLASSVAEEEVELQSQAMLNRVSDTSVKAPVPVRSPVRSVAVGYIFRAERLALRDKGIIDGQPNDWKYGTSLKR